MAKKPAKKAVEVKKVASKAKAPATRVSEVRNSPVPKKVTGKKAAAPVEKREVTREMIAHRASEIARSGQGGDDLHNWLRAERELQGA